MANIENLNRKGRKPGAKNRSTVAREMLASEAVQILAEKLTPDAINDLTPLEVLLAVMQTKFQAGDLMSAANVAEKAAPYVHMRKGGAAGENPIPPELLPDPPATPDEPGPENPVH